MSQLHLTTSLPNENRYDFYRNIHKVLRLGHCRMLSALGASDFTDETTTRSLMQDLRSLLALGRSHLEGEDHEIHAALEMRVPGASTHAADDHAHHEQAFAEIESLIRSVEVATSCRRNMAGHALYRRYALFMAADLEHMDKEETKLLCVLQSAFSDEELRAIEGRIVSSIAPSKLMAFMKLMMPALNHAERVAMLNILKSGMPPQAFNSLLAEGVRPALGRDEFKAAISALGLREAA